jgi:quercetin 2,3-dioxygenase
MPAIVTVERAAEPCAEGVLRRRVALAPERATGPILAVVEDRMRAPGGVPEHPHRGLETVTLVLAGHIEHVDSAGHRGIVGPGDVQWMTAGRGVRHGERPHGTDEARVVRFWIDLPADRKACPPACRTITAAEIPTVDHGSAWVRVVSGRHLGHRGPTCSTAPVTCLDISIAAAGGGVTIELACVRGAAYVVDGAMCLAGNTIAAGQVALLDIRGTVPIDIDAACGARVIVVAAPPLGA